MATLSCSIIRGGTSKGVFLLEDHLPADPEARDALLLRVMGSPDPRQVDGLGGADPLTSKVAIVSRSSREGVDVEYESVEVGISEARVNHGLMCGNLIAGVGYFAMAEGLIEPQAPSTTVRIFCRSNQKTIVARVPCGGAAGLTSRGDLVLDGGSSTVSLVFRDPGGTLTGKLLPAGRALSLLPLGDRAIQASIVDAGTLYAFLRAEDFGLSGHEDAATLDADKSFRADIESLRAQVADLINRHAYFGTAVIAPRLVKMAIVGPPGERAGEVDLVARVINTAKVHKAYAVSGGICLAAAAAIPGTLVREITGPVESPFVLRIGHPSGTLSLGTYWSAGSQGIVIQAAEIQRTARIIMRGTVYVGAEAGAAEQPQAERLPAGQVRPVAHSVASAAATTS